MKDSQLPLEMGEIMTEQDPLDLVIGICHRCGRQGLLTKRERTCTGYRAMTAAGGLVQVPVERRKRCTDTALRHMSKSNRRLVQPDAVPIHLGRQS